MRSLSAFWFGFTMRHSFGAQSQLIFYRKRKSSFLLGAIKFIIVSEPMQVWKDDTSIFRLKLVILNML